MRSKAELVITGARVRTIDEASPQTDAVAIRSGRIVAIGQNQVADLIGPGTQRLHLPGSLVLPGFQDAHVHPPFAGRNRRNVELNDLDGRRAHLDHIARYAEEHPDRAWIVGGGWALEHFPGGTPTAADLDAIVADRPVFLYNRDVHGAWLNSAALALGGIDVTTPDPADGRIERDPVNGTPTGTLHEGAAYAYEAAYVPKPDRGEWEAAILVAQQHLHTLGITGWQDAWVTPDTLAAYGSLADSGRLTASVTAALWWDRHRGLEQIDDLLDQRESGAAPGVRPSTVKIMVDGTMENRTGALLEPYCDGCRGHGDGGSDDVGDRGLTYVDPAVLNAALARLDAAGFSVHLHAIGDRAVRMSLDAIQVARAANGRSANRHQIAHLQLVQPSDVPRFAKLGVIANCQTYWAQSEPQMDELTIPLLGEQRARMQYPFADLLRSGARLAMGSDWAVTTADPLAQLEVAVTRIDPDHPVNAPFLPDQRLSLDDAVEAFTAGSAFANGDDDAGRIAVGDRADLTVLDGDLFDLKEARPTERRVTHTIVAGRIVYES